MNIKIAILLFLSLKTSNSCRLSETLNFVPISKPALPQNLQEAGKCFDGLITIKQDLKDILYLILTHIEISQISGKLLNISENVRNLLDFCEGVQISDFLGYLKAHLNGDGKLCLEHLGAVSPLLGEIFMTRDLPVEQLFRDFGELWGEVRQGYYYCARLDFDVRL